MFEFTLYITWPLGAIPLHTAAVGELHNSCSVGWYDHLTCKVAPLYLRILWRYTNAVIFIIIIIKVNLSPHFTFA